MQERIFYTFDPFGDSPWEKSVKESYEDGVRVFSFLYPMTVTWQENGGFDFTEIDLLTDRIIKLIPGGRMMPRVFLNTPFWWDEKYPDELLKFSGPTPRQRKFSHEVSPLWKYESKMFHGANNASVASKQWRLDAGNAVYASVRHLIERYGRKRIYAIQLAYGTCGEWGQYGSYLFGQTANGDYSKPMLRAYRDFLQGKYGKRTEFASDMPPTKAERQQTELGMLRSPAFISAYADYLEAVARAKNQALGHFCRRVKEACPDMSCGSFGGSAMSIGTSAYSLNHAGSGFDRKYLMQIEKLDFLSTPNNYFDKRKGATFSHNPVKSTTLHKLFIAECDTRTELANNPWAPDKGFSKAQFLRETAFNLLTSGHLWHYDFGLNWYALPEIRALRSRLLALPPELFDYHAQAQIAVVADPESVLCASGATGYYRQFGETLAKELPRCGAFADHIVIEDVFQLPPYKLYIFRDAFLHRPELREFLVRNRSSALWLGPAGCIGKDHVDIALAEQQTTFRLEIAEHVVAPNTVTLHGKHFLNQGLELPFTPSGVEDINALWTPVLYAVPNEGCQVAGLVESLEMPGLISRQGTGRLDAWCASPLLKSTLLRNLALAAGVKLRIAEGDAEIYGSGKTFAIHILGDTPMVFNAKSTLTDLISGQKYEPTDGKVTFAGEKGQTYLFTEMAL